MLPLNPSERGDFEAFLRARLDAAHAAWNATKVSYDRKLDLSLDMPRADGMFARRQARGNRELTAYAAALRDFTAFVVRGEWRPELMQEFLVQRRKPMGVIRMTRVKEQRA